MKLIVLAILWRKHKAGAAVCVLAVLLFALSGCGSAESAIPTSVPAAPAENTVSEPTETPACAIPADPLESQEGSEIEMQDAEGEKTMTLLINGQEVSVDWEANDSVEALRELCAKQPLVIEMSMYGGFEQVGSIGNSLPRNDVQTTTQAGDIVLYSGNQIVIFYGSNSWAYTRLGRVSDQEASGMAALLGSEDVTITISSGD
jgi:hypothetical protein